MEWVAINSAQNRDNFIEAYHLDKHRGMFCEDLCKQLLPLHPLEVDHVTIFLYASLQLLQEGSFWYRCLMTVAKQNFIQLIVIDKAHMVVQDGRSFRPEFCLAVRLLWTFYNAISIRCNQFCMLATFQKCDQDVILVIYGTRPDEVMWLKLSQKSINFDVVISGILLLSITKSIKEDYKYATDLKTIIYTNLNCSALGLISDAT